MKHECFPWLSRTEFDQHRYTAFENNISFSVGYTALEFVAWSELLTPEGATVEIELLMQKTL